MAYKFDAVLCSKLFHAILCLPLLTLAFLLTLCSHRCQSLTLMWQPWTQWHW